MTSASSSSSPSKDPTELIRLINTLETALKEKNIDPIKIQPTISKIHTIAQSIGGSNRLSNPDSIVSLTNSLKTLAVSKDENEYIAQVLGFIENAKSIVDQLSSQKVRTSKEDDHKIESESHKTERIDIFSLSIEGEDESKSQDSFGEKTKATLTPSSISTKELTQFEQDIYNKIVANDNLKPLLRDNLEQLKDEFRPTEQIIYGKDKSIGSGRKIILYRGTTVDELSRLVKYGNAAGTDPSTLKQVPEDTPEVRENTARLQVGETVKAFEGTSDPNVAASFGSECIIAFQINEADAIMGSRNYERGTVLLPQAPVEVLGFIIGKEKIQPPPQKKWDLQLDKSLIKKDADREKSSPGLTPGTSTPNTPERGGFASLRKRAPSAETPTTPINPSSSSTISPTSTKEIKKPEERKFSVPKSPAKSPTSTALPSSPKSSKKLKERPRSTSQSLTEKVSSSPSSKSSSSIRTLSPLPTEPEPEETPPKDRES